MGLSPQLGGNGKTMVLRQASPPGEIVFHSHFNEFRFLGWKLGVLHASLFSGLRGVTRRGEKNAADVAAAIVVLEYPGGD